MNHSWIINSIFCRFWWNRATATVISSCQLTLLPNCIVMRRIVGIFMLYALNVTASMCLPEHFIFHLQLGDYNDLLPVHRTIIIPSTCRHLFKYRPTHSCTFISGSINCTFFENSPRFELSYRNEFQSSVAKFKNRLIALNSTCELWITRIKNTNTKPLRIYNAPGFAPSFQLICDWCVLLLACCGFEV